MYSANYRSPLGQYFPDMNTNRSLEAVRLNVNGYVKKTNAISPASVTMKPERDRTVLEALALNKPTAKVISTKDSARSLLIFLKLERQRSSDANHYGWKG